MMDKDLKAELEKIKSRLLTLEEQSKTFDVAVREMGKKNEEVKKKIEEIVGLVKLAMKVKK